MATKRYKNVDMQRKTRDNKMLTAAVVFLLCLFLFHFPLGAEMFLSLSVMNYSFVPLPGKWTSKNVAINVVSK
jgi:hypothetical protein